jgi:predicted dienelactone hydrolase
MKKQIGIWMDSNEATLVTLGGQKAQIDYLKSDHLKTSKEHQSNGSVRRTDVPTNTNVEITEKPISEKTSGSTYQKAVFEMIKNADEWYILGPDESKTEFKHFVSEQHAQTLGKLKGIENSKHLSNDDLIDKVQNYYKVK